MTEDFLSKASEIYSQIGKLESSVRYIQDQSLKKFPEILNLSYSQLIEPDFHLLESIREKWVDAATQPSREKIEQLKKEFEAL